MSDYTELTRNAARSAAMKRIWMARRIWRESPTCCCGCGARLGTNGGLKPKLFRAGHDRRLEVFLRKVLMGEASRQDIPLQALVNCRRITFIQRDQKLRKLFLSPGRRDSRREVEA